LRDAAPTGVREIAREQESGDERAGQRDEHATPGRAARRIQLRAEIFGEHDEGDHYQPDDRPDDEGEDELDLLFGARPSSEELQECETVRRVVH